MKRILLILLLGLFGGSFLQAQGNINQQTGTTAQSRQNVVVLSLKDAITIAKEKNRDVLLSTQDLQKAEAQIDEAYGNAFPQVSLSANYQRNINPPVMVIPPNDLFKNTVPIEVSFSMNNSYTAGISVNQVLFSSKVNTAIKIAKDYRIYSEFNSKATEEEVVLNVKKTFYSVLLAQDVVEANKKGLELARANYNNLLQMNKQGVASEFDLLRAEVQVSNTEPLLSQSENTLILAKNMLKNLLGLELKQDISLAGNLEIEQLPTDLSVLESREIVENNSQVRSLEALEKINEKNISIQKADYFPTVAAFGNYGYQAQDNTYRFKDYNWVNNFIVGLQISYPIFNGLQTSNRVEQARIDRQKINIQRIQLEEGLKLQFESARLRMMEANQRVNAQAKSVEQAERAVSIAEVRFKNGVGTQLELIDSQVALTRTQINRAQAVFDYLNAKADWEKLAGFTE